VLKVSPAQREVDAQSYIRRPERVGKCGGMKKWLLRRTIGKKKNCPFTARNVKKNNRNAESTKNWEKKRYGTP